MKKIEIDSPLDKWEIAIVRELVRDSRIANNSLARKIGLAPSTTLARVKSLVDRRIIKAFTLDLDFGKLGRGVQAMISVQLRSHHEKDVLALSSRIRELPEVIQTFHVAGQDDFLVHVALPSPEKLRDFVLQSLTSDPIVRGIQTHLVFEHQRGRKIL